MLQDDIINGSLFSTNFYTETENLSAGLTDLEFAAFRKGLRKTFKTFFKDRNPNERQTADTLVLPILKLLGWDDVIQEQNLSAKGRYDVPDGLLFLDKQNKEFAQSQEQQSDRFKYGGAIIEIKKWIQPIDRQVQEETKVQSPSMQMLRYIRRVDDLTNGKLRWGILTNGAKWRLYYAGAKTISEQFFELDLANVLMLKSYNQKKYKLKRSQRVHWLKVFHSVFNKNAFKPSTVDSKTYHEKIIIEGQYYERRVGNSISDKVFNDVFPTLVKAISNASPATPLGEVRDASLIVLYRLLFILYAEDRELLPIKSKKYRIYSLRSNVRIAIREETDGEDLYSKKASRFWRFINLLFSLLDSGDESIGLPQYNGGLFDSKSHTVLNTIEISDDTVSKIVSALSFEETEKGLEYVSYRNLSIQQLGAIYERLLEYRVQKIDDEIVIRPNTYSRKNTGSYYTSDDLVKLVVEETVGPLIEEKRMEFFEKIASMDSDGLDKTASHEDIDLTVSILNLKICDPAMGSGHFLCSLVDYLADEVCEAIALVEKHFQEKLSSYKSPVSSEIEDIRNRIIQLAIENGWEFDTQQLDDRKIVRRIILKRCVYGVDKNPMAVELAKVSLWLHTFTVGAPLSFIDHHLKCGDSLFGLWFATAQEKSNRYGSPLIWSDQIQSLYGATGHLKVLEAIPDSEVAEVQTSIKKYKESEELVSPLDSLMNFIQALDWIDLSDNGRLSTIQGFFDGRFGKPLDILYKKEKPKNGSKDTAIFEDVLCEIDEVIERERFFNWQVAFPSIWKDWEETELVGGFDAIVGNPPWDRTKLEQVEWFAERKPEIAFTTRASDRKKMIKALVESADSLAIEYKKASEQSILYRNRARNCGEFPLLSGGDLNLYSLFVERSMKLAKPDGRVGLLVPSGIAHDKTAAKFFKSVSSKGQVRSYYDFENGRRGKGKEPFFPDVHNSFKFCAITFSKKSSDKPTQCAFFLHDVSELQRKGSRLELSVADFERFNPNTQTMPIFRSTKDAELAVRIYDKSVPLVKHSDGIETKAWPVKFSTMFHMTSDSEKFRTVEELRKKEKAYHIGENVFDSPTGRWLPLYLGRMFNQFDHRAASVSFNEENLQNPRLSDLISTDRKKDPKLLPEHQYWVAEDKIVSGYVGSWFLAFRAITNATNVRTMIATAIPRSAVGNTAQLLLWDGEPAQIADNALLLGNMNSIIFDFTVRQKVQATALNWYIVEQLPVIEREVYKQVIFGEKSAKEVVKEIVLELTYTSHNMAPFARDLGYVFDDGTVKPPFVWDDLRRLTLKSKLDAVYFHLYGITAPDEVDYIYSTFPIVQKENAKTYDNADISTKLCLDYLNALSAGDPDADISL